MQLSAPDLIAALADGRFHNGDELGARFNVTRAGIWKAVHRLADFGLEVHSVRGKGYRLSEPLTLLDANAITRNLSVTNQARVQELEILPVVDSTNAHALRRAQQRTLALGAGQVYVCMSEMQTAGKGRRGRQWVSPFGHNLYLSVLREFTSGAGSLEGLSLVIGIALVNALQEWGFAGLGLKWPNDVLWNEHKLAGILIEITGDVAGTCQVVIGIGLNLRLKSDTMREVEQPWISLAQLGFAQQDRNRLFGRIIDRVLTALERFQATGFGAFADDWNRLDVSAGRQVELSGATGTVTGLGLGVDAGGALLLDTSSGVRRFQGGEVTLRAVDAAPVVTPAPAEGQRL
ncbi:MAG: bifunctional biotin--[acetyl-CoA-carboxylase] ligase/biotin operon repressor BirA [Pseudomonadota bacterium]|nr:bifunctional biotin--[acetyl-CoA-carboxylase] ligase/biotin operon repressor BirA [Pseudomonadota bacterium]